jgi:hypothetical protein
VTLISLTLSQLPNAFCLPHFTPYTSLNNRYNIIQPSPTIFSHHFSPTSPHSLFSYHFSPTKLDKMTVPTVNEMMYIIHHVFLPPKLPNETDENPKYESFLLEMILDTLDIFKIHFTGDELNIICSVIAMIRRLKDSHTTSGCVSKDSLKDVLTQLVSDGQPIAP